jgi:tRNA A-37 threonylcarbamoyl transferase component Bud32
MFLNRRFGDYVLVRKIATGGMADIFLARKCGPGAFEKIVTMKMIISGRAENELFRRMFQNEAEIAARFNHPNVVQLYDVVTDSGTDAMVLEYMPGHTVSALAASAASRGTPLSVELAVWIVAEACGGLDYVHSLHDWDGAALGIVHRDVSPENLQVTYDGVVKVFDFGIAHISSHEQDIELQGAMAGKYAYMSPEQCRGDTIDARADVWSVGVLLWELTVGQRLFQRDDPIRVINAVMDEPIPRPSDVMVDYPRFLERVVMTALSRDIRRRYPSCAALRAELQKFLKVNALKPDREALSEVMHQVFDGEREAFQGLMAEVRMLPLPAGGTPLPAARSLRQESDDAEAVDEAAIARSIQDALVADRVREVVPAAQQIAATAAPVSVASLLSDQVAPSVSGTAPLPAPHTPSSPVHMPLRERSATRWWVIAAGIAGLLLLLGAAGGGLALYVKSGSAGPEVPAAPVAPLPTVGTLELVSTPAGASVTLGGRRLSVVTPTRIPDLPLGEPIEVMVEKTGFEPVTRDLLLTAEAASKKIDVTLVAVQAPQATATLQLMCVPADVAVQIDGISRGTQTPLTVDRLAVGVEYVVRITRDGYLDEIFVVSMEAGEIKDLEVELQASDARDTGVLTVVSEPPGLKVELDGDLVGPAPIEKIRVAAGVPIQVVVTDPELGRFERTVTLGRGKEQTLTALLDPVALAAEKAAATKQEDAAVATASISVTTEPPTKVHLNGVLLGDSPVTADSLRPRRSTLVLTSENPRIRYTRVVTLSPGKTLVFNEKIPTGTVTVTSDEQATVYVDGVQVGTAPVESRALYVGTHRVRVRWTRLARERTYFFRIRGGESRRIMARPVRPRAAPVGEKPPTPVPAGAKGQGGNAAGTKKKDALADEPYKLLK